MYIYITTLSGFHLEGGVVGGAICPLARVLPPLECFCQYAHYDSPVCRPSKVFQIHVSPPSTNFLNESLTILYYEYNIYTFLII